MSRFVRSVSTLSEEVSVMSKKDQSLSNSLPSEMRASIDWMDMSVLNDVSASQVTGLDGPSLSLWVRFLDKDRQREFEHARFLLRIRLIVVFAAVILSAFIETGKFGLLIPLVAILLGMKEYPRRP